VGAYVLVDTRSSKTPSRGFGYLRYGFRPAPPVNTFDRAPVPPPTDPRRARVGYEVPIRSATRVPGPL